MKKENNFSDIFDDDFEVTYEEDGDMTLDMSDRTETLTDMDRYSRSSARQARRAYDIDEEEDSDYEYERNSRRNARRDYDRSSRQDHDREQEPRRRRSSRRRGGVHLAAPIRKGGRALSRLSSAAVRSLTAILIIGITVYVCWTFWRASAPYGDIEETVRTRTPSMTLAAYLSVVAIFVLFQLISLLWSMTKVRVRDGYTTWKEDTGRGLFSFIFVFAASYLCFLLNRLVPESPEILYGLKGAMEVFGSMHNVLLGLCSAGVISCLVRKYW